MKAIKIMLIGCVVLFGTIFWIPIIVNYFYYFLIHFFIGVCIMIFAIYKNTKE